MIWNIFLVLCGFVGGVIITAILMMVYGYKLAMIFADYAWTDTFAVIKGMQQTFITHVESAGKEANKFQLETSANTVKQVNLLFDGLNERLRAEGVILNEEPGQISYNEARKLARELINEKKAKDESLNLNDNDKVN